MKTRAEALASISSNTRLINGRMTEMFDCFIGTNTLGQKVRFSSTSRTALVEKVNSFYKRQRAMGDAACLLTPSQAIDAQAAFRALENAGLKRSLSSVVDDFIARTAEVGATVSVSLGDAYAKYLNSFDPRQTAHIRSVRSRVGKFIDFFGGNRLLGDVGPDDVAQFMRPMKGGSHKTYNNVLTYLSGFFSWCCKPAQRFAANNPARDMPKMKIAYEEPAYISVDDAERLFAEIERRGDKSVMAFAALSFFCGVRFAEIERVAKDGRAFALEDETVRVAHPKGYLRGTKPRIIQAPANALAWLRAADAAEALRNRQPRECRKAVVAAAKAIGVKFPKNCGRHSFITYHVAAYGDPAKTEALAGTSSSMRAHHYMGLATKTQGERYFAIMPGAAVKAGGI